MKKTPLLAATIFLFTFFSSATAFAHPPKNLEAVWNASAQTLTVKASHLVNDTAKHYVLSMVVMNSKGEQIAFKQYTKQSSDKSFSDSVTLLNAKPGDTVKIRLVCNIMGTAEETITLK